MLGWVSYSVLEKALHENGWRLHPDIDGNQYLFIKRNHFPLSFPVERKMVRAVYAGKIRDVLQACRDGACGACEQE